MSRDRVRVGIDVGGDVESERAASRPADDAPFRIVLLGDFGARAHRGLVDTGPAIAKRRAVRVDRDNYDTAVSRFSPELRLPIDPGGAAISLTFSSIDDFHPDRIYDRVALFKSLRELRSRLLAAGSSPSTARFVGRVGPTAAATSGAATRGGGSLLDQILSDVPPPPGGESPAMTREAHDTESADDSLADYVRQAVAPHLVQASDANQGELVAKVDGVIAAAMRVILHHPDFQSLEALWRGVEFLTRRLETDERLQLHLIDVSKPELVADLESSASVERSGTFRLLVESSSGTPGAGRWSAIVGNFTFGGDSDDSSLLAKLGAVGRGGGAPWLSAGHPRLAGCSSFGTTPDPDDWEKQTPPDWDELRRTADARFIGLALPRFILRLPYGKHSDPCELFPFEEVSGTPDHDEYLWGSGAIACALVLGQGAAEDGPARRSFTIDGLPLHLVTVDGETTSKPCAEVLLPERALAGLLDRGLMPLASVKDTDAVRLIRLQSVAYPLAPLGGL